MRVLQRKPGVLFTFFCNCLRNANSFRVIVLKSASIVNEIRDHKFHCTKKVLSFFFLQYIIHLSFEGTLRRNDYFFLNKEKIFLLERKQMFSKNRKY